MKKKLSLFLQLTRAVVAIGALKLMFFFRLVKMISFFFVRVDSIVILNVYRYKTCEKGGSPWALRGN